VASKKPASLPLFSEMMLTEQIHSKPDWASLPGRVLEGGYEVQELLEAEQDRAKYKIRVLGGGGIDAFASFLRADGGTAGDQVEIWETVRRLEHANLNTPLAAGQTQLDGVELIYVVLRKPDEILGSILRERPLAKEEAGEVLVSVSRALEHLHKHDLVHGCVSPDQIFALGDSIQLSTECVRRAGTAPIFEMATGKYVAPESAGVNVRPAADVWGLGATLFEVLTQKEFAMASREQVGSLPIPFGTVVERCLDPDPQTRCDVPDAVTLYRNTGNSSAQSTQPPLRELELTRVRTISAVNGNGQTPQSSTARAHARPGRLMTWIYAGLVVIAVLLIVWAARPKHTGPAKTTTASTPKRIDARASANSSWQTRTLVPETGSGSGKPHIGASTRPAESSEPRVPASKPDVRIVRPQSANVNGPIWRVVVFTYSTAEDAQSRARLINEKHPELQAQVFSPDGSLYLVTLGGRMQRDEAARLRQQALRLGMPRDTYIQNYKQ
jgi:eukaryotic-like serine/threonine-protein kinase